jgi:hypothetical protein
MTGAGRNDRAYRIDIMCNMVKQLSAMLLTRGVDNKDTYYSRFTMHNTGVFVPIDELEEVAMCVGATGKYTPIECGEAYVMANVFKYKIVRRDASNILSVGVDTDVRQYLSDRDTFHSNCKKYHDAQQFHNSMRDVDIVKRMMNASSNVLMALHMLFPFIQSRKRSGGPLIRGMLLMTLTEKDGGYDHIDNGGIVPINPNSPKDYGVLTYFRPVLRLNVSIMASNETLRETCEKDESDAGVMHGVNKEMTCIDPVADSVGYVATIGGRLKPYDKIDIICSMIEYLRLMLVSTDNANIVYYSIFKTQYTGVYLTMAEYSQVIAKLGINYQKPSLVSYTYMTPRHITYKVGQHTKPGVVDGTKEFGIQMHTDVATNLDDSMGLAHDQVKPLQDAHNRDNDNIVSLMMRTWDLHNVLAMRMLLPFVQWKKTSYCIPLFVMTGRVGGYNHVGYPSAPIPRFNKDAAAKPKRDFRSTEIPPALMLEMSVMANQETKLCRGIDR